MTKVTQLPVHRSEAAKVAKLLDNEEDIGVLGRVVIYQNLSRYWRKFLTPSELSLALYIVDRTVGWGKTHFTACSANIIHGFGEYAPLGMSERSYFRAMNALEAKGLIARRSRRDRTQITLNAHWAPDAPNSTKGRKTTL